MKSFVIEFNRRTAERVVTQFNTPREAATRRIELERRRRDPDLEIAVILSSSVEALQRTHSRYFGGVDIAQAS